MKKNANPTSIFGNLQSIIRHYRLWRRNNSDSWLEYCIAQSSLKAAIQVAARSVNAKGVMSGHQCLVGHIKLGYWSDYLLQYEKEIRQVSNFRELHQLLVDLEKRGRATQQIEGVGELLIYDTAHRLGGYLNFSPTEVYLHNGTRKGAKKILGKRFPRGSHRLSVDLFPTEFKQENVTAAELEDILCIYKDDFLPSAVQPGSVIEKRRIKC